MTGSFSLSCEEGLCRLQGTVDFTTASAALHQTAELVISHQRLVIDMSGLQRCNSAALALIIELLAVARRAGHDLSFREIPRGISELARVCQIDSLIGH